MLPREPTDVWILCQLIITSICSRDAVLSGKFFRMLQVPRCNRHYLRMKGTVLSITRVVGIYAE